MASIVIETQPAVEPVTVERARRERSLPHTLDDDLLTAKIVEARQHVEAVLGKALITQTWSLYLHEFPTCIELPGGHIQSITSITYFDEDGAEQTLAASEYEADLFAREPIVRAKTDWPRTEERLNAVKVTYVVGYGNAADVPGGITAAILLLIGDSFENREAQFLGTIIAQNKAVQNLLWPHRNVKP